MGARFGRSSTRYGPTPTVFTGPVRKWHKKWVHVAPTSNNTNTPSSNHHHKQSNGSNGNNGSSHLLFFKWAPVGHNGDAKEDAVEEPRRRKFRYVPVAVLEEQHNEAAEKEIDEKGEDDAKPNDANPDSVEPTPKNDGLDEKPDINDVPMEENQDADDVPSTRQDLNRNLSFNLNSNDGDPESDTNADEK